MDDIHNICLLKRNITFSHVDQNTMFYIPGDFCCCIIFAIFGLEIEGKFKNVQERKIEAINMTTKITLAWVEFKKGYKRIYKLKGDSFTGHL